jgi:hypothetical protein
MSEWLDLELSHHLAAVAAPDALWDRIQTALNQTGVVPIQSRMVSPGRPRLVRPVLRTAWPIAAILTLMAAAGTLWLVAKGEEPALDLRQLAIEQLRNREPLELRSSDPAQISAWMRRAGFDVTLPSNGSGAVRLAGIRLLQKRGVPIAAVAYRVGADTATLLIARVPEASETGHGSPFWRTRSQAYAVASSDPDHAEAACLLCHTSL